MNAVAKNTFIAMVSLALFYFIFLESNSFYRLIFIVSRTLVP